MTTYTTRRVKTNQTQVQPWGALRAVYRVLQQRCTAEKKEKKKRRTKYNPGTIFGSSIFFSSIPPLAVYLGRTAWTMFTERYPITPYLRTRWARHRQGVVLTLPYATLRKIQKAGHLEECWWTSPASCIVRISRVKRVVHICTLRKIQCRGKHLEDRYC